MTDSTTIGLLIFYLGVVPFVSVMTAFLIGNLIFRTIHTRRRRIIRKKQSGIDEYNYQDVLNRISDIPSQKSESFFGYDGSIPDNTIIEKYRKCGLNDIFGEDGVIYYTDDKNILIQRNELFAELSQNSELLELLIAFSASAAKMLDSDLNTDEAKSDTLKQLCLAKDFVRQCIILASSSTLAESKAKMLGQLHQGICAVVRSKEFASLQNQLLTLPPEYTDVHSITVTINLDSGFNPIGAGIVGLNDYHVQYSHTTRFTNDFDNSRALCELTNLSGKDPFLLLDFDRAVLSSANKYLDKQLKVMNLNIRKSFKKLLYRSRSFIDEVAFISKTADIVASMTEHSKMYYTAAESDLDGLPLCNLSEEYLKMRLGYCAGIEKSTASKTAAYESARLTLHLGIGVCVDL